MTFHPRNLRKLLTPSWLTEKGFQAYLRAVTDPPQSDVIEGLLAPIEERCLQWAAAQAPRKGSIVEVGSYHGKSSINLAHAVRRRGSEARIFCVDTWRNTTIEHARDVDVFHHFIENTAAYDDIITPIRGRSEDIGKAWSSGAVDVLFIDGDHSFEGVTADIRAWVPHVKNGGLVLFHDSDLPDVSRGIGMAMDLLRPSRERKAWSIRIYWKGR